MRRLACAITLLPWIAGGEKAPEKPAEPRLLSAYPSIVRTGEPSALVLHGAALAGARAVVVSDGGTGRVLNAESADSVRVEIQSSGEGNRTVRIVTNRGVSNAVPLRVQRVPVRAEESVTGPVTPLPVVIAGKLSAPGEADTFWIEAPTNETLSFTCTAGVNGFDPSLVLAEQSGSWFDEGRMNRIAFNDEPLHFPGLSNEARIVHTFARGGKYAIQVRAFGGQGGPDSTYHLKIERGEAPLPALHPKDRDGWQERLFTRALAPNWMAQLAARGDGKETATVETFAAGTSDIPVMTVPGMVEGRITKPAETHRIRVRIGESAAPRDLAIEIETPQATMPRFNPVVRLLAPDGQSEIVTNVYTKRNNNGLYMMKMIQAKSTFTLRAAGDYLLEIRDITTDVAGQDFRYRVLVRPQIPHAGRAVVSEDHVNLEPGQSKPLTVEIEREEGFKGLVVLSAEGLPAGVTAMAGLANPVDRPALPNGGRVERYTGRPQTATLILTAASDAPATEMPASIRVILRTVVDGKPGEPIPVKEIPVAVIPRSQS